MDETLENNPTGGTLEMFPLQTFQTPTSSLEDSLVRLFQSQGSEQDSPWRTPEGLSLLRCLDSLGIKEYRTSSLRMSKDSSTTTRDAHSKSSSKSWMTWGMTVNGNCLTAKISESRNTESACSLSEILEENPDPKYFLSDEQTEKMLSRKKNRISQSPNGEEDIFDPTNPMEFLL